MKFSKASKNDGTKVTTTVLEFYNWLQTTALAPLAIAKFMAYTRFQGRQFIVEVGGIETLFYVNRAGTTLCTNAFPPKLFRPSVGDPVEYKVTSIRAVLSTEGIGRP